MKRIFFAVKIVPEQELLKMMSSFRRELKNDSIKWTESSNIHITIVFLGDTDEKRVKEIDVFIQGICKGFGEFELKLCGAGVFRSLRDPRVIWAGISNSEEMTELNKAISSKLNSTGAKLEERQFNPHLTIGRIKRINNISLLSGLLEKYKEKELQRINVPEIILYESILRPEGPLYKPLKKYSLL